MAKQLIPIAGRPVPVACAPGQVCTSTPTGVPEPMTFSLFGAGLIGAGLMRRRKSSAR